MSVERIRKSFEDARRVLSAFVDEDGKWHEARFGALSAVDENSRYLREWKGMVGRLGGSNHVLAMVDCHF